VSVLPTSELAVRDVEHAVAPRAAHRSVQALAEDAAEPLLAAVQRG